MKKQIAILALLLSCGVSFARPVRGPQDLLQEIAAASVHEINQQINQLALVAAQPQANQTIWRRGFSLLHKDLYERRVPLCSIGLAAGFLFLTKDSEMGFIDKTGGTLLAAFLPQLTAGAAFWVWENF